MTELQEPGEIFFHWLVVILAWVIGKVVNGAGRRATESRRRAIEIETESRTRVLTASADERARIARELHDIVAHAVRVMIVQAGAAEQVVTDDPEYARTALATIRTTGSDALSEMRRLVAMVRESGEGGENGALRPQPGVDSLAALVDDASSAGWMCGSASKARPEPCRPGSIWRHTESCRRRSAMCDGTHPLRWPRLSCGTPMVTDSPCGWSCRW